jgi:hypothetical protein
MTLRKLSVLGLTLAALGGTWYFLAGSSPSSGQPAVADLDSILIFKEQFNQAADQPRLIVLLSPT